MSGSRTTEGGRGGPPAGGAFPGGRPEAALTLIHRNNSPKSIGMRVSSVFGVWKDLAEKHRFAAQAMRKIGAIRTAEDHELIAADCEKKAAHERTT